MKDILKDINDLHWWFNLLVGIIVISIGYVITEFVIKPFGLPTKNQLSKKRKTNNKSSEDIDQIVLRIKANEREEVRLEFDYANIQRGIFFRLFMLLISIPSLVCYFFIDSLPIKIALIGFGLWNLYSTTRQLYKLFCYQDYYADILDKVKKDQ